MNSQNWLHFSRKERLGILATLIVIGLILYLPKGYQCLKAPEPPSDFSRLEAVLLNIDSTESNLLQTTSPKKPFEPKKTLVNRSVILQAFPFDPNTITYEDLINMGLPTKVAKTWTNFLKKGGRFYKKEDISKIYGLEEQYCQQLLPFIQLKNKKPLVPQKAEVKTFEKQKEPFKSTPRSTPIIIDINQADAETWKKISGIGEVLSQRIIKYRNQLGGFHSVDQVQTVYGLSDSTFQVIRPFLQMNEKTWTKIPINTIDAESLSKHPYISKKQAKVLIKIRLQKGDFTNFEALNNLKIWKAGQTKFLEPYLEF